jgi:hypothetical protein
MKSLIMKGVWFAPALLTLLLASACAQQRVKCDRHLVPINVPHEKQVRESSR